MTDDQLQQRISQWEKMAEDDPSNAMGWFSLGNAYMQAERLPDAARAFRKAIELDEGFSRAYQLLGQLLIKQDATDQATDVLTRGYEIAAKRGDVMPQKAMGSLLEKINAPIPQVESAKPQAAETVSGEQVLDRRTGQPGPRLADPPLRGPIGQFIYDHYSQTTWTEWIHMGTKVINEFRLDFAQPAHAQLYDQHMREFLHLD